jgi:hypothetical protein
VIHVRALYGSGELEREVAKEFDMAVHRGMILRGCKNSGLRTIWVWGST